MGIISALIVFSVIVLFHEFGHFIFAKQSGVGVTEFSLGMGPRIITYAKTPTGNMVKFFCSQKKYEEEKAWEEVTKYSWKILPLGGSCAMIGEDEASDRPDAFNNKGVWARFKIVFGGPFFNFILAFVFSIIIIANVGVDMPVVTMVYENMPGAAAGIQEGDVVKKVSSRNIQISREISTYILSHPLSGDEVDVVVMRDGEKKTITIDPNYKGYKFGFEYDQTNHKISKIIKDGAFEKAGIKEGDVISKINGEELSEENTVEIALSDSVKNGDAAEFVLDRDGEELTINVTPVEYIAKTLGFVTGKNEKVNFLNNIKYSAIEVKYWVVTVFDSLYMIFTGKAGLKDMSGPVGIVSMIGDNVTESAKQGARIVILEILYLSVLLSSNLGVMNLLPLPALDGGRLVFIIIEAIRRKPIDRDKEGMVHFVGIILLFALMIVIAYSDIMKLIR